MAGDGNTSGEYFPGKGFKEDAGKSAEPTANLGIDGAAQKVYEPVSANPDVIDTSIGPTAAVIDDLQTLAGISPAPETSPVVDLAAQRALTDKVLNRIGLLSADLRMYRGASMYQLQEMITTSDRPRLEGDADTRNLQEIIDSISDPDLRFSLRMGVLNIYDVGLRIAATTRDVNNPFGNELARRYISAYMAAVTDLNLPVETDHLRRSDHEAYITSAGRSGRDALYDVQNRGTRNDPETVMRDALYANRLILSSAESAARLGRDHDPGVIMKAVLHNVEIASVVGNARSKNASTRDTGIAFQRWFDIQRSAINAALPKMAAGNR